MNDRILRRDEGEVCILTLNRPESLNALDTATFEALDAHFADLETQADSIGCIVLRGVATTRAPWGNMYEFINLTSFCGLAAAAVVP